MQTVYVLEQKKIVFFGYNYIVNISFLLTENI